jgi:hypothetical protein
MAAGFQVFNSSGFLQIDGNYSNYCMTAKGSAVSAQLTPDVGYGVDIASGKKNSIIAIRSSTFAVVFNRLDASGNVVHRVLTETNGATFEYWVFAADPPGPSNFGFEVYNEAGVRVFSAAEKYLKLLGFYNVPVNAGTNGSVSTPGKNPAWVSASYCALWEGATVPNPGGQPISQGILRTLMGRSVAGGAQYQSKTIYTFNSNRGTSDNAYGAFLLIDVDNL